MEWPPRVQLGLGSMHWGNTPLDKLIAGKVLPDSEIADICDRAASAGVTLIDTAEGYGGGSSERRARRLGLARSGFLVATKYLPTYWRWSPDAVVRAQRASNRRLGVDVCELAFVHSPVHPRSPEVWIRGAARAYRLGLIRSLGLSNFDADEVRMAARVAASEGVPLIANQIQFNLFVAGSNALKETLAACQEHNLTVLGYGVLGQGLLTDGLTRQKFDSNVVARRLSLTWASLAQIRDSITPIATRHGRPMSHVCLAWARAHGIFPLVGTRSAAQLEDSLSGLTLSLSPTERAALDAHALARSTFDRPRGQRLLVLGFLSMLMLAYRASGAFRHSDSANPTRATPVRQ